MVSQSEMAISVVVYLSFIERQEQQQQQQQPAAAALKLHARFKDASSRLYDNSNDHCNTLTICILLHSNLSYIVHVCVSNN